ncbi:MAG: amidohydrolase family protein [Chloroflexota bacterium]|nr:amidohydrolase family protein [Chloroflexota bacterium]
MAFDVVIRHGKIVTAGSVAMADLGIVDGVIAQIGGDMQAEREIDATGRLLLPGGIDAHVHLSSPPQAVDEEHRWVDDFTSGSAAALAGGITTLGNMSFLAPGETPLAGLAREAAVASEQTITDLFLHPVLGETIPAVLDEIPQLLASGCNTIKFFMSFSHFDPQVAGYTEATRRAGMNNLLTLIHCEDFALMADATAQLTAAGRTSLRHYAESRPVISEVVATQRAVAIAEATGAPVYIVHLSSQRALEVCADAQGRGVPVYVETRPFYLHLTRERLEEPDGAKYIGQPPLREQSDVDALWTGIQQGALHTVCTDHAPWSLAAKLDPDLTITRLRPGAENLQTMLPMLYSEGVRTGRISLARFVEVTSTNAAKLFGLYPRKGTIAVGSDADIAIFDPELTRTVTSDMLKSNADYSVYEGWSVTGWPILTLRRGEIVFRDDQVTGTPGSGQLVRRDATQPL